MLCQALSCTTTVYPPGIPALLLNLPKSGIPDGELLRSVRTPYSFCVSPRWNRRFRPALALGRVNRLDEEIVGVRLPLVGFRGLAVEVRLAMCMRSNLSIVTVMPVASLVLNTSLIFPRNCGHI